MSLSPDLERVELTGGVIKGGGELGKERCPGNCGEGEGRRSGVPVLSLLPEVCVSVYCALLGRGSGDDVI